MMLRLSTFTRTGRRCNGIAPGESPIMQLFDRRLYRRLIIHCELKGLRHANTKKANDKHCVESPLTVTHVVVAVAAAAFPRDAAIAGRGNRSFATHEIVFEQ